MSKLEDKAKEYAEKINNLENLNIQPAELQRYHSLSEQEFDKNMQKIEDSLQDDIKKIPEVLIVFNKILGSLKRISK